MAGNEQWRVIADVQTCGCSVCEQGSTEKVVVQEPGRVAILYP